MRTLVIVTGGSSGLGRALLDTAPSGSIRVDVSRSGHAGDGVEHLRADLREPVSWPHVGQEVADRVADGPWDRISFFHNAATLDPVGFAGETDPDGVTANVLLNSAAGQVLGHRLLAALRTLDCRREVTMISSGAARRAVPGWATYSAGKAALDAWVRSVGEEQRRRGGVRVLSVAPGVVATPMQHRVRSSDERDFPDVQRFVDLHANDQLADPTDVAHKLWELLDDDAVATGSVVDIRDR